MRSLLIVIALAVVCTCLPGKYLSAQRVVVSLENNSIRQTIDLTAGCKPSAWTNFCNTDGAVTSLALLRDTLYYLAGGMLYQQSFLEPLTTCGKFLNGIKSDVLTVDKKGMVYWVNNNILFRFNPYLHILDTLGTLPFAAIGDMIFYKDRLYLSATGGIVEVNMVDPSQSHMVIPAPGREFLGLVNVQTGCSGNNKVYAFEFVNGTNNIIELDLEQNRILGIFCSININGQKVIDAASFFETGEVPGITISSISVRPACLPDKNTRVRIKAFTPEGDSSLQYSFGKAGGPVAFANRVPRGPLEFGTEMSPGIWNLHIKDHNGCIKDTQFVVPEPVRVQAPLLFR
jgi:hypothetical protein